MHERSRRQTLVIVRAASAMFACAAAFGLVRLRQLGVSGSGPTVVVLALPLSATLLFMIVAFLVPDLTATKRLGFPLNATLPVVFAALTLVSVVLWTSTGSALFEVPEVLRLAHLWSDPVTLLLVALAQSLVLTALGRLEREGA